jgi:hypothetical protein
LKKPFESSVVLEMVRPLIAAAAAAKSDRSAPFEPVAAPVAKAPAFIPTTVEPAAAVAVRVVAEPIQTTPAHTTSPVDTERVRAAVTLALEASLPRMIDEITERVLVALGH